MTALLAASPILLLVLGLVFFRLPMLVVAALSFSLAAMVAVLGPWLLPFPLLLAAALKGVLIALDMLIIICGALLLLAYLKGIGVVALLQAQLARVSGDPRLQAVLVAWFFGGFLEGTAGFGTPAAIVAPLLASLGFRPLTAIAVSLTSNSAAVVFGAVGTPIRVGFAGLETSGVGPAAAIVNIGAGSLVPLIIVALVSFDEARHRRHGFWGAWLRSVMECVPWALVSGFAFTIPAYGAARLGPEFPSLVGASFGLAIVLGFTRLGFFVPRRERAQQANPSEDGSWISATGPYLLLAAILLVGKLLFGGLRIRVVLPTGLTQNLHLFNPGFAFLTTLALIAFIRRFIMSRGDGGLISRSALESLKSLWRPAASILLIVALVQILIVSEGQATSRLGMIATIAGAGGEGWVPGASVLLGALGSFISGSATVSNLLLAPLQLELGAGVPASAILALQLVGAAAGNMVAIPNILAAQAAIGLAGHEVAALRRLAIPFVLYVAVATLAGAWLLY